MDKIGEQALLYDFYGELLTPHQRTVYEDVVYHDMSLGEIAQEQGISRQGVHDLIKRCDKILQDYESKLHLVERFTRGREKIARIKLLTECLPETADSKSIESDYRTKMKRIYELSIELMNEL